MALQRTYEFGPFRVDPSARSLTRDGKPIAVAPKAFDVLTFLIRHRDEVVSRQSLFDDVWANCAVEDATLTQHVYLLRRLLRVDASEPSVIATVPRRGYRFVRAITEGVKLTKSGAIVGRAREIDDLHGWLGRTASSSHVVCITGEPGIGKTALIDEFVDGASRQPDICVARSRCSELFGNGETYLPLLDLLDDFRRRYGKSMSELMQARAPHWYAQVDPNALASSPALPLRSPDQLKWELCAFLEDVSRASVVVVVIDDWHWTSVSTVELLAYLASKSDRMRVLFVLAYRPAELIARDVVFMHAKFDLQARGVCHELALGPLTEKDVERYVAGELRSDRLPAGLVPFLYSRTEGSPLFMVDLLRHLRNQQVVCERAGSWEVSGQIDRIRHDLPESTRSMIDRVLGALAESDSQLLKDSSVQGCEFDTAVLAEATKRDQTDVERRLRMLERTGVVTPIQERSLPDGTPSASYAFRHVLYQNVMYDSLGVHERISSSLSTAAAILTHWPDPKRVASRLGVLFEAGGDTPRAAAFFSQAAQDVAALSAFSDAIDLARRGLKLLKSAHSQVGTSPDELHLQLTLGAALGARDGYAALEVRRTYGRAYRLCRSTTTPTIVPALFGLWAFYGLRGEITRQSRLSSRLLDMATAAGDDLFLARACAMHGCVLVHQGQLCEACSLLERGLAVRPADETGGTVVLDSRVFGLSHLAEALALRGLLDQAVDRAHEATQRSRELASPYSLAFALTFLALVHKWRQDPERAGESAEEVVELASKHELPDPLAWGTSVAAWARCCQGHACEAVTAMTTVMAGQRASARNPQYFCGSFAEILAIAGMLPEALEHVTHAIAAARKSGDAYCLPYLWWVKGDIVARGQQADCTAEECFRTSTQLAIRQEATTLKLLATSSLYSLLNDHRVDERSLGDARCQLQDAYDSIPEGRHTVAVISAGNLLHPPA
jgi:DNA-binding winged helix-turn-helix (wHTH) protein/tetratricopeptide (TPR) repeat protein